MSTGQPPLVLLVRRGIRLLLIGSGLLLALVFLIAAPARGDRLQAALLLLAGVGFVLDGKSFRANGALLATAESPQPPWISWVSGLAFAFGAALILCAIVFLWHPQGTP